MRRAATTALGALALLLTAAIVLQVFFAGLGIFGTEGFDTHTGFGWILHTVAVVMLVLAVVGPRTGRDIGMAAALVVLMTVQIMLSNADAAGLAALHPTLALFVLGLAGHMASRYRPRRPSVPA
jgi:hypothetical protein